MLDQELLSYLFSVPLCMQYVVPSLPLLLFFNRRLLPLKMVAVREMRIGNQVDDPFATEEFTAHESVLYDNNQIGGL